MAGRKSQLTSSVKLEDQNASDPATVEQAAILRVKLDSDVSNWQPSSAATPVHNVLSCQWANSPKDHCQLCERNLLSRLPTVPRGCEGQLKVGSHTLPFSATSFPSLRWSNKWFQFMKTFVLFFPFDSYIRIILYSEALIQ